MVDLLTILQQLYTAETSAWQWYYQPAQAPEADLASYQAHEADVASLSVCTVAAM